MQIQENQKKKNDENKQKSGALKTEEILSLLSKTSQDFKKESEISENVSYLFTKKSLKDIALSTLKEKKGNGQPEKLREETKEKEDAKEQVIKEEKIIEEKKITEAEAKNMANALAKEYYNKGYNLGVIKTKEELEKGEKALAVNFKNLSDNIFTVAPDFAKKLNELVNNNLKKISREILGYEIDTNADKFIEKISELVETFENSLKKVKIFLNKEDFDSISKYLTEKKISIDQELAVDEGLGRGDLKIRSGSITVENILSSKTKFVESVSIENDLKELKENFEKSNDNSGNENNNAKIKKSINNLEPPRT